MNDGGGASEVRPARPEDLQAVVRLENLCFKDPWSPAALLSELVTDDLRLPLVVTVAGEVRGYVMAWRVADQIHILNIATDPDLQRQGLGTRLLLAIARLGAAQGQSELTLEVRRGNTPAREFYRKHGFVEAGVRAGYYADDGEDAIIMTCAVASILSGE